MRVLIWSACVGLILALGLIASCEGGVDSSTDPVAEEPQVEPVTESTEPAFDPTGEVCGGIAGIQCPAGYFCKQAPGECLEIMDGAGTCQPKPEVCTREYRPVCGCDGQTYSNACTAESEGVSIALEGECPSPDME